MTIRELIQKLEAYDNKDIEVCSGYVEQGNKWRFMDIVFSEKEGMYDRDADEDRMIFIGCNLDEDF